MNVARRPFFSWLLVLGLLAPTVSAQRLMPVRRAEAVTPEVAPPSDGINVLILGDSLALCGFGKRLDDLFRKSPRVKATFTYLTCGTNPLSWLKEKPYANVRTHCGFVSIESTGQGRTRELQDVYGMRRGYTPRAHPVPKLEDLLTTVRPDILVMQTGTNLFDLFPDHKTVSPNRHGPALRGYLVPFITKAISGSSTLRKIYWVASPTSGRVSKEVQDFVVQQTRADIGHIANVIDSRTLVPYPYRHMEPDKEHFIGEEMDMWADKVFDLVEQDLSQQPFATLKPLSEKGPATAVAQEQQTPPAEPRPAIAVTQEQGTSPVETRPALAVTQEQPTPPAERPKNRSLQVKAKLISKTEPIPLNELLPYQEYLVGYVYQITKLIAGEYSESQILVMHPAYIALKKQKLRYRIGKTYKLKLRDLEETVWKTVKSRDDSGLINLQPYIQLRDETKHPEYAR